MMSEMSEVSGPAGRQAELQMAPDAKGRIVLGLFQMAGIDPTAPQEPIHEEIASLGAELRAAYTAPSEAAALLRPARELYKSIGLDPTRRRPSSEALFRRLISGKGLYRVNAVVDAVNLCSLRMMLSIGLYDLAQVKGPIQLRLGAEGEGYQGIGKGRINVEQRWTLADREGAFGNPSSDSWRTRIREETRNLLFVAFAPAGYDPQALMGRLRESAGLIQKYCGGTAGHFAILA
jgi:DNA/RNA-binding domain of Phe-tRNA-synthetase-like protein